MKPPRIRPIAIGVFRRDGRIFVAEGYDPSKGETFYRPLGGSIAFGEHGQEAVMREMREEINAEVINLRYLGTLENIFTYDGRPGHEIVLVYEGDFADQAIYKKSMVIGKGEGGDSFKALWKPLSDFTGDTLAHTPLY